MTRLPAALLATVALLAAAACERASTQLDAAGDVQAFLTAVKQNDRTAFDRHVDRDALRADLKRQVQARAGEGEVASFLFETEAGDDLLDRLITPETFNLAVQQAGPALDRTPTAPEIAAVLKPAGEGRLCLPSGGRDGPCAATFELQDGTWKLVSVGAAGVPVRNLPYPPSAAG